MDEQQEIQQWLRDHPEFHAETPFSHATPEDDPYEMMVSRAETFSFTSTYRGYEEIITICDDHLARYERDGTLDETSELVFLVRRMREKASHQLKKLKEQFFVEDKTSDEVALLEEESIKQWRAMLGLGDDTEGIDGHDIGDPLSKESVQTSIFHRQVADLGVVHQNRIKEWLDILELVDDDLLELDPAPKDGVTHFAAHVSTMDLSVVTALLLDEKVAQEKKWENHLKQEVTFSIEIIDALHASQDADHRARSAYETGVFLPLLEAEDDASPMFDRFAGYVAKSGMRVKQRASQGQGTLLNLFSQETEWFGRAFSLAIELREVRTFLEIASYLAEKGATTPSEVEKIVEIAEYRNSRRF